MCGRTRCWRATRSADVSAIVTVAPRPWPVATVAPLSANRTSCWCGNSLRLGLQTRCGEWSYPRTRDGKDTFGAWACKDVTLAWMPRVGYFSRCASPTTPAKGAAKGVSNRRAHLEFAVHSLLRKFCYRTKQFSAFAPVKL